MNAGSRFLDDKIRTGYVCKMILHISNVSVEDFSSYKCVAVNALGETDGIIKLYGWYTNNINNYYLLLNIIGIIEILLA